jgi:hypothetical protein
MMKEMRLENLNKFKIQWYLLFIVATVLPVTYLIMPGALTVACPASALALVLHQEDSSDFYKWTMYALVLLSILLIIIEEFYKVFI